MARDTTHATILLVDDEEINLLLLERILQAAGYHDLVTTNDPREAISLFAEARPDLVCTDLHMPHMNGLELIETLRATLPDDTFLPMVVLTADATAEAEQRALSHGASDFINKPFRGAQIRLRINNLLQTRLLQLELKRMNESLEEKVTQRTIELEAARLDILERLALAAEYRDHTTGRHTQRVGLLSALLAERLGVAGDEVELIRRAAPLHDVGKIGIPDHILLKPGRLTEEEFAAMREHVKLGARLLAHGQSRLINLAEQIALTHHERWDGSGYPRGLMGDDIPQVGQVVAIADVYDTLVSERPYKSAWPHEQAVLELERQRDRWFAPSLVDAFLDVLDENRELLATVHAQSPFPAPF